MSRPRLAVNSPGVQSFFRLTPEVARAALAVPHGPEVVMVLATMPYSDSAEGWRGTLARFVARLGEATGKVWNVARVVAALEALARLGVVALHRLGRWWRGIRLNRELTPRQEQADAASAPTSTDPPDTDPPLPPGGTAPASPPDPQAGRSAVAHSTPEQERPAAAPASRGDEGKRHRRGRGPGQGLLSVAGLLALFSGTSPPRTSTTSTSPAPRTSTLPVWSPESVDFAAEEARRRLLLEQARRLATASGRVAEGDGGIEAGHAAKGRQE